jgi:hypothetical protein
MAKLRQTVSNTSCWQYRNLVGNAQRQPADEREKAEIDYLEVKKEFKSKFASKQHSRNNSKTDDFFNANQPQPVETMNKTPNKITPRASQDLLTISTANRDKSMSKTDPLGSFIPLTLTKKTVSCRPADLRI